MSPTHETPESPETAPLRSRKAGTPKNPRKGFTPLRKVLAAAGIGVILLTGDGIASHGFTLKPVEFIGSQTNTGLPSNHDAGTKGGLRDRVTEAAAVKRLPVSIPVPLVVQHAVSEHYGTVSIPRLGEEWQRDLIEGTEQGQLDLAGTGDPKAVEDYKTAVAHYTGTSELGAIGNFAVGAHRTPNTFRHLDSLALGDTISITESKTGNVYTYAVTQTIQTMRYVTPDEQNYVSGVMNPIPFDDASRTIDGRPAKNPATKRLLTLTSCGTDIKPDMTSDYRVYVIAELQSVAPVK